MLVDGLEAAVVDRADPTHLDFPYMRWIADVLDVGWRAGTPLRAVHVGAGGCVLRALPGRHAARLALRGLRERPRRPRRAGHGARPRAEPGLRVRLGDGRALLAGRPARSADVVVTDAFAGPVVPAHLTTLEYQHEVRRVLRAGGVHLMNVIDAPPGRAGAPPGGHAARRLRRGRARRPARGGGGPAHRQRRARRPPTAPSASRACAPARARPRGPRPRRGRRARRGRRGPARPLTLRARGVSSARSSSALSSRSAIAISSASCSGVRALAIGATTVGCAASQARLTAATGASCAAADRVEGREHALAALVEVGARRPRARWLSTASAPGGTCPSGSPWPARSTAGSRGRGAGRRRPARSRSRARRGCSGAAARRSARAPRARWRPIAASSRAGETFEAAMWRTLPSRTSSSKAPSVSSGAVTSSSRCV